MRLCELSPSSRVHSFKTLAVMIEEREILEVYCAMLLETLLTQSSVNAINSIELQKCLKVCLLGAAN